MRADWINAEGGPWFWWCPPPCCRLHVEPSTCVRSMCADCGGDGERPRPAVKVRRALPHSPLLAFSWTCPACLAVALDYGACTPGTDAYCDGCGFAVVLHG